MPMMINDKLIHMISYFALMLTLDFSFRPGEKLIAKSVAVLLYSSAIEYAQGYVPGRDVSLLDVFANGAGILLYVFFMPILRRFNIYKSLRLT